MNEIPQELLDKYKASIPEKVNELEKLVGELHKKEEELRLFVHKLKGSSGMYGYPEVSQICKEWEEKKDNIDSLVEGIKRGFYGQKR